MRYRELQFLRLTSFLINCLWIKFSNIYDNQRLGTYPNSSVSIDLLIVTPPGTSFTFADIEADLLTFGGRNSLLSQDSCALASCN